MTIVPHTPARSPTPGRLTKRARTAGTGGDQRSDPYTIREAADRLGVSYDAVYDHYADFGGFKVGRRILLPRSVVDRLVAGPDHPAAAVPAPRRRRPLVTADDLLAAAGQLSVEDRLRLAGRLLTEAADLGARR